LRETGCCALSAALIGDMRSSWSDQHIKWSVRCRDAFARETQTQK
jgi:hypothetical protein